MIEFTYSEVILALAIPMTGFVYALWHHIRASEKEHEEIISMLKEITNKLDRRV